VAKSRATTDGTTTKGTTVRDELGTLENDDGWRLRYVRQLAGTPSTVWRAFTEPDLIEQWFPTTIEGQLRAGGSLRFAFKAHELPPMSGEVLEVSPPNLLVFWWGTDVLRFELRDHEGGTQLTLSVQLDGYGKAARDGAGWHECLACLVAVMAGRSAPATDESWAAVHPAYAARFGAEAAAIGPPPGVDTA
jgi:uncharacterized protein YndB with AHSA1/START domain